MTLDLSPVDRASLSLSYVDYMRFSQLMEERSGLAFPEKRRTELEIGVRRAFAASTCPDLDSYYHFLLDTTNSALEMERLTNYLTIGETYFFRDSGQFDALIYTVLPELIERRKSTRTLRIWSAGCASGEEPYSIAMLLLDLLPDIENWSITILGTDINTLHLERARRAVYGQWAFRENRAKELQPRFFTQHGNQYELDPKVRQMVHFSQLNLADDDYPSYDTNTMFMDLILCRNVTIYFPESVTRSVVGRFYNALSDGGWFVIGHSEHSLDIYNQFQTRSFPDAILYKRDDASLAAPAQSMPHTLPSSHSPASTPQTFFRSAAKTARDAHFHRVVNSSKDWPPAPNASPVTADPVLQSGHLTDFEHAQELLNFGKLDQARSILLHFLSNHPDNSPACTLLGKIYANMGNWAEAERWCQLGIAHNRLNLEAYYTLALVHQHQGRPEKAIEMMKKVVYIDRNDILGHFGLADLFYTSGQKPTALKYLENARRLLETQPPEDLVPRSGDITVDRLRQTVIELQQTWGAAL